MIAAAHTRGLWWKWFVDSIGRLECVFAEAIVGGAGRLFQAITELVASDSCVIDKDIKPLEFIDCLLNHFFNF